jgi:Holliday junction resolvase RusA-like endonuclease
MDAIPSYADAPFACPPDVVLHLPVPISVNQTRRVDWTAHKKLKIWKRAADQIVLLAKREKNPLKLERIKRFELTITLCEVQSRIDIDNGLKNLIDYLKRIELIEDDSPKHMRRLVVEFGEAPLGCVVTVRPCE